MGTPGVFDGGDAVGTPRATAGTPSVHPGDGGDAVGTPRATAGTPSVHPGRRRGRRRYTRI